MRKHNWIFIAAILVGKARKHFGHSIFVLALMAALLPIPSLAVDSSATIFNFNGNEEQLTTTLVNPYSGETIQINEVKNVNTGAYIGTAGDNDVLIFTASDDAFFLTDSLGNLVVENIDTFLGGEGSDLIVLADSTFDITHQTFVAGGFSSDIIWMNIGDDAVSAEGGDDIVDGGPGNDLLRGDSGNDVLRGGDGDDFVDGGSGNDTLYGDLGSDFLSGGTGNDVLHYSADATWPAPNQRNRSHDVFDGRDGVDTIQMSDASEALYLDDPASPNPRGANTERITGVEIIRAGGGNDIVDLSSTQFSYGDVTIYGDLGSDLLTAGDGNDTIQGGEGDDTLNGGLGFDNLTGGLGGDTFVITEAENLLLGAGTTIEDFSPVENDVLDISAILVGYNPSTDLLSSFLSLQDTSGTNDAVLFIDADGGVGGIQQVPSVDMIGFANYLSGAIATETQLQQLVSDGLLVVTVPEPSTLFLAALAAFGFSRGRRPVL